MDVTLQPNVLRWARERAGLSDEALAGRLRVGAERVAGWEANGRIGMAKAKKLASVTHTPLGFLFLAEPPEDRLPIPDFRTVGDTLVRRPSPDLLDTVHAMQRRQAWMRDLLVEDDADPLPFVRSATLRDRPVDVAARMRAALGLSDGWADDVPTWSGALAYLRERIEAARVLIVINGVVGNNTHRTLDPEEFRGFALVDPYAPLIFVNGADAKAAQMFTFAHELAHVWIGADGVSDLDPLAGPADRVADVERFCNAVAAEFVVPERELRARWAQAVGQDEPFQYLARTFKVSPIVAARRALELSLIARDAFQRFYAAYQEDDRRTQASRAKGGNFWNTQNVRVGRLFGEAVVRAVQEGRLLYTQAYQLTDLHGRTFDKFAQSLAD